MWTSDRYGLVYICPGVGQRRDRMGCVWHDPLIGSWYYSVRVNKTTDRYPAWLQGGPMDQVDAMRRVDGSDGPDALELGSRVSARFAIPERQPNTKYEVGDRFVGPAACARCDGSGFLKPPSGEPTFDVAWYCDCSAGNKRAGR